MNDSLLGKIFPKVEADSRVTPDLWECLSCKVAETGYAIPLRQIVEKPPMRICPSCRRIYVTG